MIERVFNFFRCSRNPKNTNGYVPLYGDDAWRLLDYEPVVVPYYTRAVNVLDEFLCRYIYDPNTFIGEDLITSMSKPQRLRERSIVEPTVSMAKSTTVPINTGLKLGLRSDDVLSWEFFEEENGEQAYVKVRKMYERFSYDELKVHTVSEIKRLIREKKLDPKVAERFFEEQSLRIRDQHHG